MRKMTTPTFGESTENKDKDPVLDSLISQIKSNYMENMEIDDLIEFDKSKDIKLYDTSILSHQSKLYYFKRMYETNVNQEILQPDDNIEFLKQKES